MDKPRARHDGKPDLVEGFQQPFGRRLSRPAFGVARKRSCDLLVLLPQSERTTLSKRVTTRKAMGKPADETDAMIITLHIQRPQRQRVAFASANVALDQGCIARGFDRPGQIQSTALLVGGVDPPAQLLHRTLDGLLVALDFASRFKRTVRP